MIRRVMTLFLGVTWALVATSIVDAQVNVVVAMGASTGGDVSLLAIAAHLGELRSQNPGIAAPPILIVQHGLQAVSKSTRVVGWSASGVVVKGMSGSVDLLDSFQTNSGLVTKVAGWGNGAPAEDILMPNHVYFAPHDRHLGVLKLSNGSYRVLVSENTAAMVGVGEDSPGHPGYRPSVDPLFETVGFAAGASAIGFQLVGQGRDGADGLLTLSNEGGLAWSQDPRENLGHPSMPIHALYNGAAEGFLTVENIAKEILDLP